MRSRADALLVLIVLLFWLPLSLGQSVTTGSISGRVFNTASASYVANATVMVEGTSLTAITDDSGSFVLHGVPVGTARVVVAYVGFAAEPQKVTVSGGATTMPDFNLRPARSSAQAGETVQQMATVTVVADREQSAQAIALNDQRNAPSLRNVIAVDEYAADTASGNAGELLKYIPGLAIIYSANAPLDVSVRGLPGYTTEIMMDGASTPSAYPSGTRGSSLFGVPFSNIQRIEATKMPTPDVPAASLGGTINFISNSGFRQKKASLDYNVYSTFDASDSLRAQPSALDVTGKSRIGPSFNLNYVLPIGQSLSFTLGGGYIYNFPVFLTTTPTYNIVNAVMTTPTITYGQQVQATINYNLAVDWKVNDANVVKFTYQGRKRDANSDNATFQIIFGSAATGDQFRTQGVAAGSGGVAQTSTTGHLLMDTKSGTLSHTFRGRRWKVESGLSYSWAHTQTGNSDGAFQSGSFRLAGNHIVVGTGIKGDPWGTAWDVLPTNLSMTLRTTGQPVDLYDASQLVVASGVLQRIIYERTNEQAKTMVTRELGTAFPLTLRAGAQYNRLGYGSHGNTLTYTLPSDTAGHYGLVDGAYTMPYAGHDIQVVNLSKLYALYQSQPNLFTTPAPAAWMSVVNNYRDFDESIAAGFVRADAKLYSGRLWLVGGVRYERTTDKGRGPLIDPSASLQKDEKGNLLKTAGGATVPIATDALQVAKLQYVMGGAHADRHYDDYFPSLNATYAINANLLLRVGYARTIGRPELTSILPGTTFSATTANPQTITINNTGLQPWTANNYDLTFESYLFKGGVGSIGVFEKDIHKFFEAWQTPATPELLALYGIEGGVEGVDYQVITKQNGTGKTQIRGFEFNYKQDLAFLPHWARGVQVFLNYTKLDLAGSALSDFTGFNPKTLSFGLNLVRPRFSVNILIQQQGEVRRAPVAANATSGIPANTYLWQERKLRPTLTATCNLTRYLSIYGSVSDFFGRGFVDRQFQYPNGGSVPEYAKLQRIIEAGTQVTVGVKGKF